MERNMIHLRATWNAVLGIYGIMSFLPRRCSDPKAGLCKHVGRLAPDTSQLNGKISFFHGDLDTWVASCKDVPRTSRRFGASIKRVKEREEQGKCLFHNLRLHKQGIVKAIEAVICPSHMNTSHYKETGQADRGSMCTASHGIWLHCLLLPSSFNGVPYCIRKN